MGCEQGDDGGKGGVDEGGGGELNGAMALPVNAKLLNSVNFGFGILEIL